MLLMFDNWTVGLLLNVDIYGGVSYYLVVIFCVFFELWNMEYVMYNMIIEDKLNLLKWPTFLMYFCYINFEYFFWQVSVERNWSTIVL